MKLFSYLRKLVSRVNTTHQQQEPLVTSKISSPPLKHRKKATRQPVPCPLLAENLKAEIAQALKQRIIDRDKIIKEIYALEDVAAEICSKTRKLLSRTQAEMAAIIGVNHQRWAGLERPGAQRRYVESKKNRVTHRYVRAAKAFSTIGGRIANQASSDLMEIDSRIIKLRDKRSEVCRSYQAYFKQALSSYIKSCGWMQADARKKFGISREDLGGQGKYGLNLDQELKLLDIPLRKVK